jgi:hypothetical protein
MAPLTITLLQTAMCLSFELLPVLASSEPSTNLRIEPAVTKIPTTIAAGASLQESETLQLTDEVVARLSADQITSEFAEYFTFENSAIASGTRKQHGASATCKTFPGEPTWPGDNVWKVFSELLGGALIPTVPIAASCYDTQWGEKDANKCADVTKNFTNPLFHHADPASNMWPIFQGRTCMPTNDSSTKACTLGGYPEYAIKVTNVAQIQLAINFARNAGIRLVIKNTGHCYLGKSTGAGALSLWTHNLNKIDFIASYVGPGYSGPALKLAAGVTVREVYEAADKNGVTVLGAISWVGTLL